MGLDYSRPSKKKEDQIQEYEQIVNEITDIRDEVRKYIFNNNIEGIHKFLKEVH